MRKHKIELSKNILIVKKLLKFIISYKNNLGKFFKVLYFTLMTDFLFPLFL